MSYDDIRAELARQNGRVSRTAQALNISIPTVKRARDHMDALKTKTCAPRKPGHSRRGYVLAPTKPAAIEGRTMFPTMVRAVGNERLLKSGINSSKIGGEIFKGRWTGFPVYTLTLEERKTCPRSCRHWLGCYGNGSPYSRRFEHGPALEGMLAVEVAELALKHRGGFVVRLHQLGDFYSVEYVELWYNLLLKFPQLNVYGYTARIDPKNDEIAAALARVIPRMWDRFAIRLSDGPGTTRNTISVETAADAPADAVVCPAQTGQSESCSCCALCWQSEKRIAFVKH